MRILDKHLVGNFNELEFKTPEMIIARVDNKVVRARIMSIDPIKMKELKINKPPLWYQQKKIKEGKEIKVYGMTGAK